MLNLKFSAIEKLIREELYQEREIRWVNMYDQEVLILAGMTIRLGDGMNISLTRLLIQELGYVRPGQGAKAQNGIAKLMGEYEMQEHFLQVSNSALGDNLSIRFFHFDMWTANPLSLIIHFHDGSIIRTRKEVLSIINLSEYESMVSADEHFKTLTFYSNLTRSLIEVESEFVEDYTERMFLGHDCYNRIG